MNKKNERDVEQDNIEACPGCGCLPGDGITETCDHPDGCGYFKDLADELSEASDDDLTGRRSS